MARKQKSIGALLAELRWKKMSDQEKKAHGRKLTDARLAKRATQRQSVVDLDESNVAVADDDGAPE